MDTEINNEENENVIIIPKNDGNYYEFPTISTKFIFLIKVCYNGRANIQTG
jgi:hypothetical protein